MSLLFFSFFLFRFFLFWYIYRFLFFSVRFFLSPKTSWRCPPHHHGTIPLDHRFFLLPPLKNICNKANNELSSCRIRLHFATAEQREHRPPPAAMPSFLPSFLVNLLLIRFPGASSSYCVCCCGNVILLGRCGNIILRRTRSSTFTSLRLLHPALGLERIRLHKTNSGTIGALYSTQGRARRRRVLSPACRSIV